MRIGIIGLGHVFEHHLAALELLPEHELVAVCDRDVGRLSKAPLGPARFENSDELLRQNLDAVIVSTDTRSHTLHAIAAIDARVPLLLEKPAALTRDDYQRLRAHAERQGIPVVVLFHAAHASEVLMAEGQLSALPLTAFAWHSLFSDPYLAGPDVAARRRALVTPWIDSGINALSVVVRLIGVERELRCVFKMDTQVSDGVGATTAVFHTNLPRPAQIVLETSWASGVNHKSSRIVDLADDREWGLNHSDETAYYRDEFEGRVTSHANERPRLTNHYLNTLREALSLIARQQSNWGFSDAVHHPYFDALEWSS